jgi:Flp pilus assembly pilin Flp
LGGKVALVIAYLETSGRRLYASQSAATMIEYGLIVSAIAVLLIVSIQTLGTNINTMFQYWVDFFAAH